MYSRTSSRPTVETKYPQAQKCCPTKFRCHTGQIDRAFALDEADHMRNRIFRWDGNHHVNVVGHQVPLFDSALLLLRQFPKHLSEVPSQLRVKRLPPAFWNEYNMIFALPLAVA
jgi:hypothetical protein